MLVTWLRCKWERSQPRPGVLLGSTNPIILSAARHYPHILRVGPTVPLDGPVQGVFGSLAKSTAGQSFKEAQTSPHGLFSERKRHIKKDSAVLKAVEERMRAGDCEPICLFCTRDTPDECLAMQTWAQTLCSCSA